MMDLSKYDGKNYSELKACYYNEDSKSSTVYDYDYIEESSCISVDYNRDGIKGTARARIRGRQYWLENLVEFVVEKAGEKKKKVAFEYQMQPGGNLVKRKKRIVIDAVSVVNGWKNMDILKTQEALCKR